MRRAVFSSCLLATTWFVVSATARARPTAKLELTKTEEAAECVSQARLERTVEARLRRAVFKAKGEPDLRLRVELSRRDGAWFAALALSDARGPLGDRELSSEARHCSALDESLALVVALLVDTPPQRPAPAPPAEAPSAPPAASPAAPAPPSPATPAPPSPVAPAPPTRLELPADAFAPRQPWDFATRASGLASVGLLPSAAFGIELMAAARPPRGPWLRVLAELDFPSEVRSNGYGVSLSALRFGFEICSGAGELGAARFDICAGQRVGRLHSKGSGFDHNLTGSHTYFGLVAGGDGFIPLGRYVAAVVGARLELPLSRDRFAGRDDSGVSRQLFRPSAVAGLGKLGIEVAW